MKTITSFHFHLHPKTGLSFTSDGGNMAHYNSTIDWSIVVDATDDYESKIAKLSADDAENLTNNVYDYVKSTFQVNAALKKT